MEWDYENYQKACKLLGGGMSNPNTYKELKDQKLREFAKITPPCLDCSLLYLLKPSNGI